MLISAEIATFGRNCPFLFFLVCAEIAEILSGAFSTQIICRKQKECPFGRSLAADLSNPFTHYRVCGGSQRIPRMRKFGQIGGKNPLDAWTSYLGDSPQGKYN